MREIKFRGKRLDNGNWVYGSLLCDGDNGLAWIVSGAYNALYPKWDEQNVFKVDPETVGQYTGLKDKNGVEIYEGDIVRLLERANYSVEWDKHIAGSSLILIDGDDFDKQYHRTWNIAQASMGEIIGNIYENSELLESAEDTNAKI